MELINPDQEDLTNKNIEINTSPDITSKSSPSINQEESNIFQNFVSGFKNFIKPKITSNEIEKDNIDSNQSTIEEKMTNSSREEEPKKEETCRDKIINKLVSALEVEKSIGIFIFLLLLGIGFIFLSFFLLPLIVVSPKKFSFCFAIGSILVLASFLFLVGTKTYVTKLLDNKRIYFSISFILSIFIGIGFSLKSHYFISMICSGVQLISMIMFVLTFIPGGRAGIDCIKNALTSPFTKLFINKAKSELTE